MKILRRASYFQWTTPGRTYPSHFKGSIHVSTSRITELREYAVEVLLGVHRYGTCSQLGIVLGQEKIGQQVDDDNFQRANQSFNAE